MHQNSLNKSKKQLLSTNYSTIMRPIGCFWRFATYFSSSRAAGTAFSRLILRKTDRLFAFPASSRDVFGRSEEGRFTLHGASGYAPRRIGLRSTERETTPYMAGRNTRFLAPPFEGEGLGVGVLSRTRVVYDRPHPYPLPSEGRGKAAEQLCRRTNLNLHVPSAIVAEGQTCSCTYR